MATQLKQWGEILAKLGEGIPVRSNGPDIIAALRKENKALRDALKGLLDRDMRNTCQHEDTNRGGAIWEICSQCGAKWADDEGGIPEWKDPPEWKAAIDALAKRHD